MRLLPLLFLMLPAVLGAQASDAFAKGELLYSQGKYTVAADLLAAAVKDNPLNADAWLYLANIQTLASNYLEADRSFQKALELRPDSVDIHLGYGGLKRLQRLNDVAEAFFQKALKLSATSVAAHEQLAKLYFDIYEWNKAADELEAVLVLAPAHAQRPALEKLIPKLRKSLAFAEQKRKELASGGKPAEPPPLQLELKPGGKPAELKTRSESSVDAKKPDADIVE